MQDEHGTEPGQQESGGRGVTRPPGMGRTSDERRRAIRVHHRRTLWPHLLSGSSSATTVSAVACGGALLALCPGRGRITERYGAWRALTR